MNFIKKNQKILSSAMLIGAGALLLAALHLFAPVCDKSVILFNKMGDEILKPMACFHTGKTAEILAFILIALGIDNFFKSRIRLTAIAIGILLILLPGDQHTPCALGVCLKPMACHSTAIWIRVSGAISIIAGLLNFIKPKAE